MASTDKFRSLRVPLLLFVATAIFFSCASPVSAQNKKKKGADSSDADKSLVPIPDDRAIDLVISDMLGAWQLGDLDRLHKDYADDVIVVSGDWSPPVIGWEKFSQAYQQQRARIQSVRMDRFNTFIKVEGNIGWANYQWEFEATADGQPTAAHGQTTLVFEKRDGRWLIVHNHTSLAQEPPAAAQPSQAAPAQPNSKAHTP